mmetsp:Transcript_15473/g.18345  ORF Transcript_15473/g.18345 Transcript_15473/m.18345 type:complete len:444 (-) Transcript_15473:34-1365(-)
MGKKRDDDGAKHSSDEEDEEEDEDLRNAVAQWAHSNEDTKDVVPAIEPQDRTKASTRRRDSDSRTTKQRAAPMLSSPSPYAAPYNPNASGPDSMYSTGRTTTRSTFSLHITNLPYSSTKDAIVKVFEEKGCRITSTRLVYNYHSTRRDRERNSNKKNQGNDAFTGVAFIDMADKGSYRKGLGMDKMQWLEPSPSSSSSDKKGAISRDSRGRYRKINVRPTRTKEELTAIVKNTEERLTSERNLIKEERDERKSNNKKRMREIKSGAESSQGRKKGFKEKKSKEASMESSSVDNKDQGARVDKSTAKSKMENDGTPWYENDDAPIRSEKKDKVVEDNQLPMEVEKITKKQCDTTTSTNSTQVEQTVSKKDGGSKNKKNLTETAESRQSEVSTNKDKKLPSETIENPSSGEKTTPASTTAKAKKKKKISKKERAKKAAILRSIKN